MRLLVDCRDGLVGERARIQKRLRWNCHDLEVALELPPRVLDRLEDALGALPHSIRRRIAIEQVSRCRDLTSEIRSLEREIRGHMRVLAPGLMEIPGCSAISAAHLAGQIAGASRFTREAAFAMHIGTAVLPVSSGRSERCRLNRTGDRKRNPVVHVIAVTQVRMHPPAIASVERTRRGDERPRGAQMPEAAHRQDAVQDDGPRREGARLSRCPRRLRVECCRCRGVGLT